MTPTRDDFFHLGSSLIDCGGNLDDGTFRRGHNKGEKPLDFCTLATVKNIGDKISIENSEFKFIKVKE